MVVGDNDAAYGFLENLVTSNEFHFNRISMLCENPRHIISDNFKQNIIHSRCIRTGLDYNYLKQLSLTNKIEDIRAELGGIDIEKQTLELGGTTDVCPYDILILASQLGPTQILKRNADSLRQSMIQS